MHAVKGLRHNTVLQPPPHSTRDWDLLKVQSFPNRRGPLRFLVAAHTRRHGEVLTIVAGDQKSADRCTHSGEGGKIRLSRIPIVHSVCLGLPRVSVARSAVPFAWLRHANAKSGGDFVRGTQGNQDGYLIFYGKVLGFGGARKAYSDRRVES